MRYCFSQEQKEKEQSGGGNSFDRLGGTSYLKRARSEGNKMSTKRKFDSKKTDKMKIHLVHTWAWEVVREKGEYAASNWIYYRTVF